jgi:hypothetical protein
VNDEVRKSLCRFVAQHGGLPRERVEAFIPDVCRDNRAESHILVCAVREGVPDELLASGGSLLHEVLLTRLTGRLQSNRAIAHEAARWAVETWALALGVISEAELQSPKPEESGGSDTQEPSRPATRRATSQPAFGAAFPQPTSTSAPRPSAQPGVGIFPPSVPPTRPPRRMVGITLWVIVLVIATGIGLWWQWPAAVDKTAGPAQVVLSAPWDTKESPPAVGQPKRARIDEPAVTESDPGTRAVQPNDVKIGSPPAVEGMPVLDVAYDERPPERVDVGAIYVVKAHFINNSDKSILAEVELVAGTSSVEVSPPVKRSFWIAPKGQSDSYAWSVRVLNASSYEIALTREVKGFRKGDR